MKRLVGVTWGCSFNVLRTSTSALVYDLAKYCSQAWCQSAHTRKLDTQLNEAMCPISCCIRSTPTDFLSGILPPTTRRNVACLELHRKPQSPDHLLHETLHVRRAPNRLRSRRPLRPFMENLTNQDYSLQYQIRWSHISLVSLTLHQDAACRAKYGCNLTACARDTAMVSNKNSYFAMACHAFQA